MASMGSSITGSLSKAYPLSARLLSEIFLQFPLRVHLFLLLDSPLRVLSAYSWLGGDVTSEEKSGH